MMPVLEGRYFHLNKKFFILTGLWPYETRTNIMARSIFFGGGMLLSLPQLLSAILHYKDVDRLMMNLLIFLIIVIYCFKLLALLMREVETTTLCESIEGTWRTTQDEIEREMLCEYSEKGRTLTILYTVAMLSACISMCTPPWIPKILDKINPLSEPRANIYVLQGEFFVDSDAHFLKLYFCDLALMVIVTIGCIAIDSMYMVCCQHCCALFAIVGYRLENLGINSLSMEDNSHDWMIRIIKVHRKALDFTSLINNSFCVTFLIVLTLYFTTIPLISVAILANLHKPLHLFPYIACFSAVAGSLVVVCWPGQFIFDHGLSVRQAAYCSEWYAAPIRTKRLLLTFMLRCSEPSMLTAGGILPLNFETLSMIMRTAGSYVTVLASFR